MYCSNFLGFSLVAVNRDVPEQRFCRFVTKPHVVKDIPEQIHIDRHVYRSIKSWFGDNRIAICPVNVSLESFRFDSK
jgi:hypothetical protein